VGLLGVVGTGFWILLAQNDGEDVLFYTRIYTIERIKLIREQFWGVCEGVGKIVKFPSDFGVLPTHATSTEVLRVKMNSDETFDKTLQKEQLENLPTWVSEFSKDLRGIRYPSQ